MKFCEILEQLLSRIIVVGCFLNENREGEGHAVTLLLSVFHFFRGSCLLSYETMFILRGGSRAVARLEAVNCYNKALHLGCCSSPRSASGTNFRIAEHFNLDYVIRFYVPKTGLSSPIFTIKVLVVN